MDDKTKKVILVVAPLIVALLSILVIARFASSVAFHAGTIASLDEKKATVMQLAAVSTGASAAITLIPGDVMTPIADKLADVSSYFIIVICAIYLEKYLLTITGYATFYILVPMGCVVQSLHALMPRRGLDQIAKKLILFGLAIVLVIPASVGVSGMIERTYSESIEITMNQAMQATESVTDSIEEAVGATDESSVSGEAAAAEGTTGTGQQESGSDESQAEDRPWWHIFSDASETVTNTVQDAFDSTVNGVEVKIDEFKNMLNNMMEALAVMIVTSCLIPIIVLLFFVWLIQVILNVNIPAPPMGRPPRR